MRAEVDDVNSYDDSEQFEEDSMASYASDIEPVANRFIDWKMDTGVCPSYHTTANGIPSLLTLCSQVVGQKIPFELVETHKKEIPPHCQELISYHCFPCKESQIRLYSCLTTGTGQEFEKGFVLFNENSVRGCRQIGFRITASVRAPMLDNSQAAYLRSQHSNNNAATGNHQIDGSSGNSLTYHVSIAIDRHTITECVCTCCPQQGLWCRHIVAVILCRIRKPERFKYSLPISENLNTLSRDDLQKLAQFLIAALPATEMLPAAQDILDKLLSNEPNEIKDALGGPDSTSGGSIRDIPHWCFDEKIVNEKLNRILQKFIVPGPFICSDKNLLHHMPTHTLEYWAFLRPLRSKEPEGIWNLITIIENLFRNQDSNGLSLLRLLTRSLLEIDTVMVWWYSVRSNIPLPSRPSAPNAGGGGGGNGNMMTTSSAGTMYANNGGSTYANNHKCHLSAADFCDEMVHLWHLATIQPTLSHCERDAFIHELNRFHEQVVSVAEQGMERLVAHRIPLMGTATGGNSHHSHHRSNNTDLPYASGNNRQQLCLQKMRASQGNKFPGFLPAIQASKLVWDDSKLPASLMASFQDVASVNCLHSLANYRRGQKDTPIEAELYSDSTNRDNVIHPGECNEAPFVLESMSYGGDEMFSRSKEGVNAFEILIGRCQGLYYHGHVQEAIPLIQRVCESILTRQEVLFQEGDDAVLLCKRLCRLMGSQYGLVTHASVEVTSISCGYTSANSAGSSSSGTASIATPVHRSSGGGYHSHYSPRNVSGGGRQNRHRSRGMGSSAANQGVTSGHHHSSGDATPAHLINATPFMGALAAWPKEKLRLLLYARDSVETVAKETSRLFSHVLFLCRCLLEEHQRVLDAHPNQQEGFQMASQEWLIVLVFRICFLCLTLPRPPTIDKALQVKIINQETEIVGLLRRLNAPSTASIPSLSSTMGGNVQSTEFTNSQSATVGGGGATSCALSLPTTCYQILRQQGHLMRRKVSRYLSSHVPFLLATFIFEKLSLPYIAFTTSGNGMHSGGGNSSLTGVDGTLSTSGGGVRRRNFSRSTPHTTNSTVNDSSSTLTSETVVFNKEDHLLGFEAAVACLGVKLPVVEKLFPMLVEGQRKQKDDLAMLLCNHYKHEPLYLEKIIDELLDRGYNPDFKAPPLSMCVNLSVEELIRCHEEDNSNIQASNNTSGGDSVVVSGSGSNVGHVVPHSLIHSTHSSHYHSMRSSSTTHSQGNMSHRATNSSSSSMTNNSRTICTTSSLTTTSGNDKLSTHVAGNGNLRTGTTSTRRFRRLRRQSTLSARINMITLADAVSNIKTASSRVLANPLLCWSRETSSDQPASDSDPAPQMKSVKCAPMCRMAGVDSSAPETTSSGDNSPATARRRCQAAASLLLSQQQEKLQQCQHLGEEVVHDEDDETEETQSSSGAESEPIIAVETVSSSSHLDESTRHMSADNLLLEEVKTSVYDYSTRSSPVPRQKSHEDTATMSMQEASLLSLDADKSDSHISNEGFHSISLISPCQPTGNSMPCSTEPVFESTPSGAALDLLSCSNFLQKLAFGNGEDTSVTNNGSATVVGGVLPLSGCTSAESIRRSNVPCAFSSAAMEFSYEEDIDDEEECCEDDNVEEEEDELIVTNSMAYHMYELGEKLIQEAGGVDARGTMHFTQHYTNNSINNGAAANVQGAGGVGGNAAAHALQGNRNLQLCGFMVCLYSLGLQNQTTPNWQSRAYSMHVSTISTRVNEIGAKAAYILLVTWRKHFTPSEVAQIADKASKFTDRLMASVAAELCLSFLSESSMLKPQEISRALEQCKEQSNAMLERALILVEKGAVMAIPSILPEVFFHLAHCWDELYTLAASRESQTSATRSNSLSSQVSCGGHHLSQQQGRSSNHIATNGSSTANRGTPPVHPSTTTPQSWSLPNPAVSQQSTNWIPAPHGFYMNGQMSTTTHSAYLVSQPNGQTMVIPCTALPPPGYPAMSIITSMAGGVPSHRGAAPSHPHLQQQQHPYCMPSPAHRPPLLHGYPTISQQSPPWNPLQTQPVGPYASFAASNAPPSHTVSEPQVVPLSFSTPPDTGSGTETGSLSSASSAVVLMRSGACEKLQRAFTCCMHALCIIIRTHTRQELVSGAYTSSRSASSNSSGNMLTLTSGNATLTKTNSNTGGMNTIIKPRSEHFTEMHWGLKHVAMKVGVPEVIEYCDKMMQCVTYPKEIEAILREVLDYCAEILSPCMPDLPNRAVLAQGNACESGPLDLEEMLGQLVVGHSHHHHHSHHHTGSGNQGSTNQSTNSTGNQGLTASSRYPTHHRGRHYPNSRSSNPMVYPTAPPPALNSNFSSSVYNPQHHMMMLHQLATAQMMNYPLAYPASTPVHLGAASAGVAPSNSSPVGNNNTIQPSQHLTNTAGNNGNNNSSATSTSMELSPLSKSVVELVHRLRNKIHFQYRLRLETLLQLMSEKDYDDCATEVGSLYRTSMAFPAVDSTYAFSRILTKLRHNPKCNDKLWIHIDAALRLIHSEKKMTACVSNSKSSGPPVSREWMEK